MIASPVSNAQSRRSYALSRWKHVSRQTQQSIVVALLLLLCYGYFRQVPAWNEYSRYDLVRAIVDDRSVQIDRYHENTGDKAFYNGHYYSDKMPGSALLGVPVYALLRGINTMIGDHALDPAQIMYMLTFAIAGVPTIVTALLLLQLLRAITDEAWALTIAITYALGTIAFPFATMYFGHAASTSLLFASFYLLWGSRDDAHGSRVMLAGLAAGWAVLTEIPVVLGVAVLFVYCVSQRPRRALPFIVGGLPALIVLLGYNWLAFDHPLRLGYQYTTNFAEQNSRGIVSIVLPDWSTTVDLLLAPRGLLRLSPWLAFAPCGLWALRRPRLRPEIAVCAAIVVAFLAYNSGALNPFGGWTPGPRYLVPALPFAAMLVAFAPLAFRPIIAALAAASLALTTIATATMPNAPESFADPTGDVWLPRLVGRDLATTTTWLRWGLHGIAPLILLGAVMLVILIMLWATTRRVPRKPWFGWGAAFALMMVLVITSIPTSQAANSTVNMTIIDGGVTFLRSDEGDTYSFWTQLMNNATTPEATTVLFQVFDDAGEETWAGWQDVDWQQNKRQQVRMDWSPGDAAAGIYWLDVSLVSADQQTTFARTENLGRWSSTNAPLPTTTSGHIDATSAPSYNRHDAERMER